MEMEFDLRKATAGAGGMFVLSMSSKISREQMLAMESAWRRAWARAGHEEAPAVMILDAGVTLEALTDARLESMGLMRVKG